MKNPSYNTIKNSIIPAHWDTLTEEGESFYNKLAKKYVKEIDYINSEKNIREFIKENVIYALSEEGTEAEASSKETQHLVIDFLTVLFSNKGFSENDIIEIYQNEYWKDEYWKINKGDQ